MVVLIILLVLILLIFFVPYGVDVSYEEKVFRLRIALGPFRYQLFPKKPLTEKQKEKARRKKEKKDRKAAEKKAAAEKKKSEKPEEKPDGPANETVKVKKERKLDADTILALIRMGMRALGRFFRVFRVDFLKLHLLLAGSDPYKLAMTYGYLSSALEALPVCTDAGVGALRRDIVVAPDFVADKMEADVRLIVTVQLFRIVHIACAFGAEFLVWYIKNRRAQKAAATEEGE